MPTDDYPHVWLGDDGVMRIDYGQDTLITLDAIRQACARMQALSDQPHPLLIMGREAANTTLEAEEFAASDDVSRLVIALARLMKSFAARQTASVYHNLRPLPYPSRAFLDEADALAWLKRFIAPDGKPHG